MEVVGKYDLSELVKKKYNSNTKTIFIRINPYPLNDTIKYIYNELSDLSWVNKYKKEILRKSIEVRIERTLASIELKLIHARSDISVGDILYASICPLGRCYLIKDKIKNWDINESVFSIRANKEVVTSEYLYMIFKHEAVIKKLTNAATGSIFKGIRINDLLNIYIPIPDKETMDKISENIKCILELQRNIYSNAKELSDISDLILPLIMRGQIK